jgi:hypothetical protein
MGFTVTLAFSRVECHLVNPGTLSPLHVCTFQRPALLFLRPKQTLLTDRNETVRAMLQIETTGDSIPLWAGFLRFFDFGEMT